MLINTVQHLLKSVVYPQYWGLGFTALSTAYNMCALLILVSPLALLLKSKILKSFIFYVGTSAGFLALLIPYWNIGDDMFDPEVIRFFICHAFLLASSILPLITGLHKPSYKFFPYVGLCFFSSLGIILLNDTVCVLLGIYPGVEHLSLTDALKAINPVWSFGPPDVFSWLLDLARVFSPSEWVFDNAAGAPLPILWYIIPAYIIMTLVAFPICVLADRKNFIADFRTFKQNRQIFSCPETIWRGVQEGYHDSGFSCQKYQRIFIVRMFRGPVCGIRPALCPADHGSAG
jgi:hypothetical protein